MNPVPSRVAGRVRCAIYTRKSSEEGLEQSFNSLDAQKEACAAYILSQASEGWVQTAELYDDGGLSGGTLQRPALQRLLADVAAGRVDIIVVYKVDRLTRSLLDFSKLVEAFDTAGTSFVSVTQSFNTTTSMGRLTLNMLLSFAQFEREVTAERVRDKIAASKARGILHLPILDSELFQRVQAMLKAHTQGTRDGARAERPSLLAGTIVDEAGEPLVPVHATKPVPSGGEGGKVRYRYYVSQALQHAISDNGMRIPAREIEIAATEHVASMLDDPLALIGTAWLDVQPDQVRGPSDAATRLAATVRSRSHVHVRQLITRVAVDRADIGVTVDGAELATVLGVGQVEGAPVTLPLRADVRLTRTGRMMRLITPDGGAAATGPGPALLRLLAAAASRAARPQRTIITCSTAPPENWQAPCSW